MDFRYALRMMRRAPEFSFVAVLSLALGIGANTAIFSLVNTLLLRLLPVQQPQQLVELLTRYPGDPHVNAFSSESYEYLRDHNHVFSDLIGATMPSQLYVRSKGGAPETVSGQYITANFFSDLGVKPAAGRLIAPDDDQENAAVVSWVFWKTVFNLDPAIQGKQIVVDDVPLTIVGIAPREFSGWHAGFAPDLWIPRRAGSRAALQLVGRLKPGVSIEQARAEMTVLYRWTVEQMLSGSKDPLLAQMKIEVEPAAAGLATRARDQFGGPLLLVMALVGLLLLLACANLAGMLLARGAVREREMAVRVWLGAGRWRLVRQVLTESLLLALIGGLAGVVLAYFGTGLLLKIISSGRDRYDLHVSPDATVLLFTLGVSVLTGVLFGLPPALRAFFSHATGRSGETRWQRLFGRGLVTAQVALSLVLLSAAGLFVRNLANLERLDLGFNRDHVLLVTLDPAHSGYTREQLTGPYRELLRRFEAIPGVRSATLSAVTPISGAAAPRFATVEGHQESPSERRYIMLNSVAPRYFETLGTPLLVGRDFNFDDAGRPRVAIVNRTMARYYFGGGSAIGKHVNIDGDARTYEIVGVAGDSKYAEIREDTPRTIYFNTFQQGRPPSQFALRTSVDPAAVAGEVRRVVRESLKTVPLTKVTTLSAQVDASIVPERLTAMLSGAFGGLGAVLAAIGIYGLLAYRVARRINEIGVRMALGATRGDLVGMVLREALGMLGLGLLVGLLVGLPVAVGLSRHWPESATGAIVFGATGMILVGLVAAYIPARRAAGVEPMEALRHD